MVKDLNKPNLSISNFKGYLLLFTKLCVILIFVLALCLNIMPQYTGEYSASLMDKVTRLQTLEGPKIVLIGNSNLSFGIDSAMIEANFGMPVVNMGFHGGCGNAFHEEMAKINVYSGDIYILCHTNYLGDTISEPVVAWTALENHFALWRLLRLQDIPVMVRSYPSYLRHCIGYWKEGTGNRSNDGVYAREAFNKYGDIGKLRIGSHYTFSAQDTYCPDIDDATVQRINSLNRYLQERNASLVIAAYPIAKGDYTPDEAEYVQFQNKLSEKLECAVISDFRDYMFDYSYFYDTAWHLNTEGVQLRTTQLIKDLNAYMNSPSYALQPCESR